MADAAEKHGSDPKFVEGLRLAATTAEALAVKRQPFGTRSLDQIREDGLAAVAEWEAENGVLTREEIAAAKAGLDEADSEARTPRVAREPEEPAPWNGR